MVPQVESDQKDPSGHPRLPKAAGLGRLPTGLSSGAPCPYPRRESRVVKPSELLHKESGIKAVFSLAPLPRRPCMGESPCSLGGGVNFVWAIRPQSGIMKGCHPPLFPTNSAGGHGMPGKCQQENAYGQCLPKASEPQLNIPPVHTPAPSHCNDMLCNVMERGFQNYTGKSSDAHRGEPRAVIRCLWLQSPGGLLPSPKHGSWSSACGYSP